MISGFLRKHDGYCVWCVGGLQQLLPEGEPLVILFRHLLRRPSRMMVPGSLALLSRSVPWYRGKVTSVVSIQGRVYISAHGYALNSHRAKHSCVFLPAWSSCFRMIFEIIYNRILWRVVHFEVLEAELTKSSKHDFPVADHCSECRWDGCGRITTTHCLLLVPSKALRPAQRQ
jgi:hypothetical protein